MRWLATGMVGAALAFPAVAEAATGAMVADTTVRVSTPSVAPVKLRCERARTCRGLLSLTVACDQRDEPVVSENCAVAVGHRRFTINGRRARVVEVPRNDVRFTSAARDAATVTARVWVAGRRYGRPPPGRRIALTAPRAMPRPAVAPSLFRLDAFPAREQESAYDLAFEADVPRGSFLARVAVGGRALALHPAGAEPFVVPPRSWVPGGVAFHGVLRTAAEELPPHSRQAITVTGCTIRGCVSATTVRTLPGPNDIGPICHIGLGPVSAPGRLIAGLPR